VRRHVRECEECADFRSQVRSNEKLLAALFPVPALFALKGFIASKLGLGGGSAAGSAAAGGAAAGGGAAAAGGAASGIGAALGGTGAAGGLGGIGGAIGGAIGTKAVAGVVTAAVLTAGAAVELPKEQHSTPVTPAAKVSQIPVVAPTPQSGGIEASIVASRPIESTKSAIATAAVAAAPSKTEELEIAALASTEEVTPVEEAPVPPEDAVAVEDPEAGASEIETGLTGGVEVESATAASPTTVPGAHTGKTTVTVTVTPETPLVATPPATTTPPPATPPPATTEAEAEAAATSTEPAAEAPTAETP
jgi:hypothetical protein